MQLFAKPNCGSSCVLYLLQGQLSCTGCGSTCTTFTAAAGTLSDGSGSAYYPDSAACQWVIAPTGASQIYITFTEFSTESCCDFVRVYSCVNSQCVTAQEVQVLSGTYSTGQVVTVASGYALVQFTSDGSVTSSGFTATWSSNAPTPSPTPSPTPQPSPAPTPIPVVSPMIVVCGFTFLQELLMSYCLMFVNTICSNTAFQQCMISHVIWDGALC
jgi:hypothetical protein